MNHSMHPSNRWRRCAAVACATMAVISASAALAENGESLPSDVAAKIEAPRTSEGDGLDAKSILDAMAECRTPAVSIAIFEDFELAWAKAWGMADVEAGVPATAETLFQAASISKPVAAMAVVKAAQDGLFDLDADINTILTSWELPKNELTEQRPVTPAMLLSHTGGTSVPGFPGYAIGDPIPTVIQVLNGEEPANTDPVIVETLPGTKNNYSGGGSTVMQLALCDARQKAFPDILKETVLDPIGMSDSFYSQEILPPALDAIAARAYEYDERDESEGTEFSKYHLYPEMQAAALWTTAADLAKFGIEVQKSLLGESNKVLDVAHTKLMVTPVEPGADAMGFATELPGREKPSGDVKFFYHTGGNYGFRSFLFCDVDEGFGFVILANSDEANPLVFFELPARIRAAYGWPDPTE